MLKKSPGTGFAVIFNSFQFFSILFLPFLSFDCQVWLELARLHVEGWPGIAGPQRTYGLDMMAIYGYDGCDINLYEVGM